MSSKTRLEKRATKNAQRFSWPEVHRQQQLQPPNRHIKMSDFNSNIRAPMKRREVEHKVPSLHVDIQGMVFDPRNIPTDAKVVDGKLQTTATRVDIKRKIPHRFHVPT